MLSHVYIRYNSRIVSADTVIAVASAVTASALMVRILYLMYTWDSVYIPELRPMYAFVRHWL